MMRLLHCPPAQARAHTCTPPTHTHEQVQRISTLEAQHARLLLSLPPHLQAHHRARHQQAAAEDASCGGAYEFPPLILDEPTFRLQMDSSSSNSSDSAGGGGRSL